MSAAVVLDQVAETSPPRRVGRLFLCLGLSLLYCAFWALVGAGGVETYQEWLVWAAIWAAYWSALAVLQVRWWALGYAKFWRPAYSWSLLAICVLSFFLLPLLLLLVPAVRRWARRVSSPKDPPEWDQVIRKLAALAAEGHITADEFEAKKADVLQRVSGENTFIRVYGEQS